MNILNELMDHIAKIPVLSPSATKLIQMIGKESALISELAEIIKQDGILTAKILKIVNSAAFSLSREITSIEQAIPYLGTKLIQAIAIESSAPDVFGKKLEGYKAGEKRMWEHGIKTAIAANYISKLSKEKIDSATSYTGGIMHDIGKSVISSFLLLDNSGENISKALINNPDADFLDLEEQTLGIDHAKAGYLITKHWRLPEVLQNVVLYHHTPMDAPLKFRSQCFCVHLADTIAMMSGIDTGVDGLHYKIDPFYKDYFKISEQSFYKIILDTEEEYQKTISAF